jgi:hypothetical protein
MKYDKETTDLLVKLYDGGNGTKIPELAIQFSVPERSIIAKLSSLGLYKKSPYLNKQGEPPIKKEEYIERLAEALDVNLELLESLEKCNKNVLKLILEALQD